MIKNKELRTTVALITESKVIQLFCITDSLTVPIYQFRNFFDADAGVNFTSLMVNLKIKTILNVEVM